ncbi:hypothetical protein [Sphingopyxis sp. BSNA05]|nr:hypothetical protein [Sphingopyxis sp. BSNA05]
MHDDKFARLIEDEDQKGDDQADTAVGLDFIGHDASLIRVSSS